MGHRRSYTVVIPARNEEANLRPAVEGVLHEVGPGAEFLEVVVVDDASTDGTASVAHALALEDARVRVLSAPRRLNIGGCYKAGLQVARGEYFFLFPGDNEERADEMARALRFLDEVSLIVIWFRNTEARTWRRRVLSRAFISLVNTTFGTDFKKVTGPNIWRTAVLRQQKIRSDGFASQTEALVRSVRSGLPYAQVGILTRGRKVGRAHAISWRNLLDVGRTMLRLWWDVRVVNRRLYPLDSSMLRRKYGWSVR